MPPRTTLAFALLLALTVSCATQSPNVQSGPPLSPSAQAERDALLPKVEALSRSAQGLLKSQDELIWKNWTEGAVRDIDETYRGKEALFTPQSIHNVERLRELSQDPKEIRALTHLQNYVVGEYLAQSVNDVIDAIANLEASMSFTLDGRDYPYRNLERLLANEKSTVKRRELYAAATPSVERLSQSLRRKNEQLEELVVQGLGYSSYQAFGAELRQVNLDELGLIAEHILDVTERPYKEVLTKLAAQELQLPVDKLQRADIPRLFRPVGVDAFFPKAELIPRAEATLKGMGFELKRLPNIRLDLKDSPAKNPRALTLSVDVPKDIRVSLKLTGGVRDQRAVFHELGHALTDAFVKEQRFELKKLGNSTTAEAFSNLFEGLVEDPVWLERTAGLSGEKRAGYLADEGARQLFLLRKTAGSLIYQLALHHGPVSDVRALYKSVMERTYGIPMKPDDLARAVVDQEDFYPAADRLRASFLASQLKSQLTARFGPAWWTNPRAGELLKSIWANGNAQSADAVASSVGESSVKPDALLTQLATVLGVSFEAPKEKAREPAPSPPPVQG